MAEKVTTMVLKVDLQCPKCYKEIKKLLCKFPKIHNQIYDEKKNTVTITVVCCSPEKVRDKLCCKGGKTIKSIEIKPPPPKAEKPDPPPTPKPRPVGFCCWSCYEGQPGGPCYHLYGGPVPCYDNCGYYGCYAYGGNSGCYTSRCDIYFSEENTSGCRIM